jgi:hypothetical protein
VFPGDREPRIVERQATADGLVEAFRACCLPQEPGGHRVAVGVCLPDQLGAPAEHLSDGVRRVARRERGLEKQVYGVPGLRRRRQPEVPHQMRPRANPYPRATAS